MELNEAEKNKILEDNKRLSDKLLAMKPAQRTKAIKYLPYNERKQLGLTKHAH